MKVNFLPQSKSNLQSKNMCLQMLSDLFNEFSILKMKVHFMDQTIYITFTGCPRSHGDHPLNFKSFENFMMKFCLDFLNIFFP